MSERPKAITELALMGISAVQLMPSVESVCKKALNDLIGMHPVGRGAVGESAKKPLKNDASDGAS